MPKPPVKDNLLVVSHSWRDAVGCTYHILANSGSEQVLQRLTRQQHDVSRDIVHNSNTCNVLVRTNILVTDMTTTRLFARCSSEIIHWQSSSANTSSDRHDRHFFFFMRCRKWIVSCRYTSLSLKTHLILESFCQSRPPPPSPLPDCTNKSCFVKL